MKVLELCGVGELCNDENELICVECHEPFAHDGERWDCDHCHLSIHFECLLSKYYDECFCTECTHGTD